VNERLYRSPADRVIAGVAGGLAVWLDIDPSLVRIGWVLLGIFTGGIFVVVYFVMMIVVPLPPPGWMPRPRNLPGGAPPPGWQPTRAQYGDPAAPPAWGQSPAAGSGAPPPAWGQQPPAGTGGTAPGGYPDQPAPAWGSGQPGGGPDPAPWTPPKPRNAGIVAGAVLILLGAWFLVDQYIHINWDLVWPVIVIGLGVVLIAAALRRRGS